MSEYKGTLLIPWKWAESDRIFTKRLLVLLQTNHSPKRRGFHIFRLEVARWDWLADHGWPWLTQNWTNKNMGVSPNVGKTLNSLINHHFHPFNIFGHTHHSVRMEPVSPMSDITLQDDHLADERSLVTHSPFPWYHMSYLSTYHYIIYCNIQKELSLYVPKTVFFLLKLVHNLIQIKSMIIQNWDLIFNHVDDRWLTQSYETRIDDES